MGVFGRSREIVFESHGRRRRRARPPRWLVLLLTGIALGAAAVITVQQRYLPPRLSFDESAHLSNAFNQADAERQRLRDELEKTRQRLEDTVAKSRQLADEVAAGRAASTRLRDDLAVAVESLPPDPRGGQVEVRAAQFVAKGNVLEYDIVLLRDGSSGKPMPGVLQFVVAGESARGAVDSVTLKPVSLLLGRHQVVRGEAALPDGFKPRQTTVQVLDREAGKALGMRVLRVR